MHEINNISSKILILVYDSHSVSVSGCQTLLLCAQGKVPSSSRQYVEAETLIMTA